MKDRTPGHTPRFHVATPLAGEGEVALSKESSRHLLGVLRARSGDTVCLFDGDGHDYRAELLEAGRRARLRVLGRTPNTCESPLEVTLVQGISRGDRMDATVRQAVELGVARIVPVETRRGRVTLDEARAAKRHAHWQAIVVSACEQCGRARLPALEPPCPLGAWFERFDPRTSTGLVLVPEAASTLGDVAAGTAVTLLVGPESGLDGGEREAALAAGLHAVRFGPRVLRTETAGPAALAVLQARHGDMLA